MFGDDNQQYSVLCMFNTFRNLSIPQKFIENRLRPKLKLHNELVSKLGRISGTESQFCKETKNKMK